MKPYEFLSHIVDDTIASVLASDRYTLLHFRDYIRYDHELASTDTSSTPYMWIDHKFMNGATKFHVHGFRSTKNYQGAKGRTHGDINFLDHSFEPVYLNLDKPLWDDVKLQKLPHVVIHSEQNSSDIKNLNLPCVHWFSHAYLCSRVYFQNYQYLKMVTEYRRPIQHPWICANRLIRKHRTDFLELLDLDKGCYSFLNPDPNGVVYNGPVWANSFDDHCNSSAEIKLDEATPWNTSFLHVVSETVWQDKIHFTEKVFKPVVLHQPFVVLQAPGSLAYLHSYGFKTFGDWWDESYDTIEDPTERMQAIADIVNWIPTQNLDRMRTEMSGVLEHNFRHFYENIPDIVLDELRVNLKNAV